jgi:hypothetical protein
MLRRYLFIMACIGLLSVSLSEKVFAYAFLFNATHYLP